MSYTDISDPCLLPPAGPLPGYSIPVLSDASLLPSAGGDGCGGGGTTAGWGRLGWGRRSPCRSHAAQGGVHRIRAARGGRLGPSRKLQWLEARPRRARGAGGGDVAETQAGGASDEGGAESAGATPREVLETPASARVQVSAGLQGRRPGWARVRMAGRCVLLCAEPGAGSGVAQPRAPRPAPRFCTRLGSCPARVPSQG